MKQRYRPGRATGFDSGNKLPKVERPKFTGKRPALLKEARDQCSRSWHGRGSRGRARDTELEEPILRSQVHRTSLEEPSSRRKVRHCFDLSGWCVLTLIFYFFVIIYLFWILLLRLCYLISLFVLIWWDIRALNWRDGTNKGLRQEIWGKAELKEDASSMRRLAQRGCELEAEMLK